MSPEQADSKSSFKPFTQGRFEALPALPHPPHPYFESEALNLNVHSAHFGQMNVHVRRHGQGPPLLLIHGLMTSSYSWRYTLAPLGKHFTCYAPDLPGAGRSGQPNHVKYTPQHLALWIREVMDALGITGCQIVANSMGGYLSMHLALQAPDSMERLVNLHSPGVPELRLFALRSLLSIPGSKQALRWLIHRDPLRWAHKNVHYYDERLKSLEEAKEYGNPLATADGADALYQYLYETLNVFEMRRFHRELTERKKAQKPFPVPLLLMYAKQDPMVPPRFGEVFASQIPDAKFLWLEEASHFAHVDALERFLPPVLSFLGISNTHP